MFLYSRVVFLPKFEQLDARNTQLADEIHATTKHVK